MINFEKQHATSPQLSSHDLDTTHQMNDLQGELLQCQDALRQSEDINRQQSLRVNFLETECRNLTFNFKQAEAARAEGDKRHAALYHTLQLQENSRVQQERRAAEQWQTLRHIAETLHTLRNYVDGKNLSDEERKLDVSGIIMESEHLKDKCSALNQILEETQEAQRLQASKCAEQQEVDRLQWNKLLRLRDRRILELEKVVPRVLNVRRASKRGTGAC